MACATGAGSKRSRLRDSPHWQMQAGRSLIKILRKNHVSHTVQSTGNVEASRDPAYTPVGIVRFIRSGIVASEGEPWNRTLLGKRFRESFHLYQETNKHRAVLSLIWRNDTRRARELEILTKIFDLVLETAK